MQHWKSKNYEQLKCSYHSYRSIDFHTCFGGIQSHPKNIGFSPVAPLEAPHQPWSSLSCAGVCRTICWISDDHCWASSTGCSKAQWVYQWGSWHIMARGELQNWKWTVQTTRGTGTGLHFSQLAARQWLDVIGPCENVFWIRCWATCKQNCSLQ